MLKLSGNQQSIQSRKKWGDPIARFYAQVRKTKGCWIWLGCTGGTSPYGLIWWNGKQRLAHKVAFEISGRTLKVGQCVLHHCDNPICVRPDHLWAGTQKENMHDCVQKGRFARGLALNHPPQNGELNYNARLLDIQIVEMRRLFADGWTQADLMRKFETTRANVHVIVRNKSRT